MSDTQLPSRTADLIDRLDRLYPPRCIRPGESLEDAHRYAGKRDLIDELIALRDAEAKRAEKARQKVT